MTNPTLLRPRIAQALTSLAMLLLLMTVTARAFLNETPFHVSSASVSALSQSHCPDASEDLNLPIDRSELARVCFAVVLLAALALWIVARSISGAGLPRYRVLAVLIVAFAALCITSVLAASDKRAAYDTFIEQVSLLAAAFLAAQLFGDRKRFVLLMIVLAAIGATLACKSYLQYFSEIPETIRQFHENPQANLQSVSAAPGSPHAQAFENRLTSQAATGYFGLANLFASLMVVLLLAALGLAADKLRAARRDRGTWQGARGEMHAPTVAAALSLVLAVIIAPALILTMSRGGIIAGLAAIAAAALIFRYRQALARRWKQALIATALVLVLLGGAVAAYGLKYDSLPSKTMTFRWYYWTATSQIIAQHPATGVGPGNFPAAYLAARRPVAEEAVRMPHNFVLHALAEFGLPAGVCYLAVIVYMFVGICRPRARKPDLTPPAAGPGPLVLLPIILALPAGRLLFGGSAAHVALLVYDAMLPAFVLGLMLLAFSWQGRGLMRWLDLPAEAGRIALACGLGGFLLHDLIEFGLFMPGAATAFWVAAGACLARSGPPSEEGSGEPQPAVLAAAPQGDKPRRKYLRLWIPGVAVIAVVGAAWQFALPVYQRTIASQQLADACKSGNESKAIAAGIAAANADPLDPYSAQELAQLLLRNSPDLAQSWAAQALGRDPAQSSLHQLLADATLFALSKNAFEYASWGDLPHDPDQLQKVRSHWQQELDLAPNDPIPMVRLAGTMLAQGDPAGAIALLRQAASADPASPMIRVLLGETLWRTGDRTGACQAWQAAWRLAADYPKDYLDHMQRAVQLNPNDSRLRIAAAQLYLWAGQWYQARQELAKARWISDQLPTDSIERLKPGELIQIQMLQDRAACLSKPTSQVSNQD